MWQCRDEQVLRLRFGRFAKFGDTSVDENVLLVKHGGGSFSGSIPAFYRRRAAMYCSLHVH